MPLRRQRLGAEGAEPAPATGPRVDETGDPTEVETESDARAVGRCLAVASGRASCGRGNMANRSVTRRGVLSLTAAWTASILAVAARARGGAPVVSDRPRAAEVPVPSRHPEEGGGPVQIHYLEIVTPDVDATCALRERLHGVSFGEPEPGLGGARTAPMAHGGMMGVRAPMHDGERPVTRAYALVTDLEAAVAALQATGAEIAVPPMELPGHGRCAIYLQGGIEAGLWEH